MNRNEIKMNRKKQQKQQHNNKVNNKIAFIWRNDDVWTVCNAS